MSDVSVRESARPLTGALAPDVAATAPDTGTTTLAGLFRDMNETERRTLWACVLGYVLDGLDFTIYTLVLGTVIAMWNVDRGTAGLTVTATLLCSAVGGWGAGLLS